MISSFKCSSGSVRTWWCMFEVTMQNDKKASDPFVWLPCLRCGQRSVPIPTTFLRTDGGGTTYNCRFRSCEAEHFFAISRHDTTFLIAYQRHTLRYPLEYYDQGTTPFDIRLYRRQPGDGQLDDSGYVGPVVVYPRKKRFAPAEVRSISNATGGCHICQHPWQLSQRGTRGWHIDHVIPHAGGGAGTEQIANFRVACAKCNLEKGKGFTEAVIRLRLRELALALCG